MYFQSLELRAAGYGPHPSFLVQDALHPKEKQRHKPKFNAQL